MMGSPVWMWYPDDFEIYHHMLLQNRRIESGVHYGNVWQISSPHRDVVFTKEALLTEPETVILHCNTSCASLCADGRRFAPDTPVLLSPGKHKLAVFAFKDGGFPCAYVEGNIFASGESWLCRESFDCLVPVGTNAMYTHRTDNPEVFPFQFETIFPVSEESINGGRLFDFGKETFAGLHFDNLTEDIAFTAYLGESREEALSEEHSDLYLLLHADGTVCVADVSAFRYVFIKADIGNFNLWAEYEYLPIETAGSFHCNDDTLNAIWDTSLYTFQLNSREGFLDGIKRDRWVWSGDAYQSAYVSAYLYADEDIVRRTIVMLRGHLPIADHINTICDYTFYWIGAIREYCTRTGDMTFLRRMYRKMSATMEFVESRLDEDGMYVRRPGDWVFIDWARFDRDSGPMCAEQMLLWYAYDSMCVCTELMEKDASFFRRRAWEVKTGIEKYWNEEKGAYVDDYKTGNNNVTRHANIFALRYHIADENRKEIILKNVLFNHTVPAITTPYFRFYELDALGEYGRKKEMLDRIRSYWGGMPKEGATSIWEAYDPDEKGAGHYAMYGRSFGKSLCHAWGASPVYLQEKFILGVEFCNDGKSFTVKPDTELLSCYEGTVPVQGGVVRVQLNNRVLTVWTDAEYGHLTVGNTTISLQAGKEVCLSV